MPIVIKEIKVKTTVVKTQVSQQSRQLELIQLKKELMKEIKDFLHKEYLRKYEY